MAQTRASWKGYLKVGELACPIALYAAASSSERIVLHAVDRATGHRLRRQFVDSATGDPVERDEQIKGYEIGAGDYIGLEPEEIAAAIPEGDKTLAVSAFVDTADIDDIYFDRPYYLAPSDRSGDEAYALIRRGLEMSGAVAIAEAVMFRRARVLAIRPHRNGLAAITFNYDYEVRPASEAFADIPDITIQGEMLELARHIIDTKRGDVDPSAFSDRYEAALAELVKAKLEGRRIAPPKRAKPKAPVDLMAALRESARLAPAAAPAAANAARRRGGAKRRTA